MKLKSRKKKSEKSKYNMNEYCNMKHKTRIRKKGVKNNEMKSN